MVDLSAGKSGIVAFKIRDHVVRFFSLAVEKRGEDEFGIRWEDGWYKTYKRDGTGLVSGVIHDKDGKFVEYTKSADCIEFIPCNLDDPRAAGLPTQATP